MADESKAEESIVDESMADESKAKESMVDESMADEFKLKGMSSSWLLYLTPDAVKCAIA